MKNTPSGVPVTPCKTEEINYTENLWEWQGSDRFHSKSKKTRQRFSSQIGPDVCSGLKLHVIKFAKAIDYVSYICFPQEEAVMALTSKTDVKFRLPQFFFSCTILLDYLLLTPLIKRHTQHLLSILATNAIHILKSRIKAHFMKASTCSHVISANFWF